jgi:hypothetical protein
MGHVGAWDRGAQEHRFPGAVRIRTVPVTGKLSHGREMFLAEGKETADGPRSERLCATSPPTAGSATGACDPIDGSQHHVQQQLGTADGGTVSLPLERADLHATRSRQGD